MSGTALDDRWVRRLPPPLRSWLVGRTNLQRILSNAGWLVADKVTRLGIGIAVNIAVARYLGPVDFGLLNYAQAIVTMFAFVATLGLPDILVNDLTRMPFQRARILASAFWLRLAGAVVVLIASVAIIVVARPGEPRTWGLVALFAAAQLAQAMDVIDSQYQVAGRVRAIVLIRNATFVLFAGLKVAAMALHMPVTAFAILYSAELLVVAVLMYLRARHDRLAFAGEATLAEMRRLLADAAPLILRLGAIGIYTRIDQVMIGRMLGDAQVGLYVAATRLTEPWYLMVTAAMTAFVPRLSQLHHFENDIYEAQLIKVIRALAWGAVGFALIVTVIARPAVLLLYGARFAPSIPVLMIHAWATVFSTSGQAVSAWFVNKRLIRYGFYQAALAAVINVVLCLTLIPQLGIAAAAMAAVASQFVAGIGANALFAATRPILRLQLRALAWR